MRAWGIGLMVLGLGLASCGDSGSGSRCEDSVDFAGVYQHDSMVYQEYDQATGEVTAAEWPEGWQLEIEAGEVPSAFVVRYGPENGVKILCMAQSWAPETLECVDVDDLGIFTFQAIDLDGQCNVLAYDYVHREMGADCDPENDVNCPGNTLISTSVGVRVES